MRSKVHILCFLVIIQPLLLFAQNERLTGKVISSENKEPLADASIKLGNLYVRSGPTGAFSFSKLANKSYQLQVSYQGYASRILAVTIPLQEGEILIQLDPKVQTGEEIVVTASKKPEKIIEAPAAIHLISQEDIKRFAGSNVGELIANTPGVQPIRTGVDFISFNARGFTNGLTNKMMFMIDGRNNMSPISTNLPMNNNSVINKDDIEKIEVVLGPQAALYGPHVHNGLINVITKDPWKSAGTSVSVTGGNHAQFSARIRQAGSFGKRLAYKFTGEYVTGKEFIFYDSVYVGGTPYGPRLAVPERNVDFNFLHIRTAGSLYYRVGKGQFLGCVGTSYNNFIGVTNSGRNQMRGLKTNFYQLRYEHPSFFINFYDTWVDIRNSYSIGGYTRDFWNRTHSTSTDPERRKLPADSAELFARNANTFRERSARSNADAQFNHHFSKQGIFLVAGLSFQQNRSNSFNTPFAKTGNKTRINQYGSVLQLEKYLPWKLRFISAMRVDHHSSFGNFFTPKFAISRSVRNGSFRLTWGKAYSIPNIGIQFGSSNGITFGNGKGIYYIPNETRFSDPLSVKLTSFLKPEQVKTWELGYRGKAGSKLYLDINGYYGFIKNFIGPPLSVAGRALRVGNDAVTHNPDFAGTVNNDTLRDASFNTYFNFGDLSSWGADIVLNYAINEKLSYRINYSFFDSFIPDDLIKSDANKDGYVSLDEKSYNAPNHKIRMVLGIQQVGRYRIFANLSGTYTSQYDLYSGNQIGTAAGAGKRGMIYRGANRPPLVKNFDRGPLGGYLVVDLQAGTKLTDYIDLNMNLTNLFNVKQLEYVGSPYIGRLFSLECRVRVPQKFK